MYAVVWCILVQSLHLLNVRNTVLLYYSHHHYNYYNNLIIIVWKPQLSTEEKGALVELHKNRPRQKLIQQRQALVPPPAAPIESISQTTRESLLKIRQQGLLDKFYAIVDIHGTPYSVTRNDIVVVKRMPGTRVGDELTLRNVREIGSKDYYIRGSPLVDHRYFDVRAVVLEQPWSAKYTKFLRRVGQGPGDRKFRKRSYRDKLNILRISDITVNDPEHLIAMK